MKKLHLLALVALIMLGLSGCEKATVTNEASADVYVEAIKNAQGVTAYIAIHSVISYNGNISSVSVKAPDATIKQLVGDAVDTGYSFYNSPAETEYLTTLPLAGVYTYTVKFTDGEEKIYTNTLTAATILPTTITSLAKSANADSVYVSWNAIAGAHAYKLIVMKGTTRVSASYPFTIVVPKIGMPIANIYASGAGVYTFKIIGLFYESTVTYDYLQAISTTKSDISL